MPKVQSLSYIGFHVTKYADWHPIFFDILGLEERRDSPAGVHQFRLDSQHHRISLIDSDVDGLAYVGWEVDSPEMFAAFRDHLKDNGIDVQDGSVDEKNARCVQELLKFRGPDDVVIEVCFGPLLDNRPFESSRFKFDGYRTGEHGLGHVVYHHSDRAEAERFYIDIMGMRLSDYIFWDEAEATFLHCNPRHHSVAVMNQCFGTAPGQFNHLMLEAESIDDIGRAYDDVKRLGIPLIMSYGKHTNDKVTSFYMVTPAGFGIEYGFGGVEIDDSVWKPVVHNAPQIWGHELNK